MLMKRKLKKFFIISGIVLASLLLLLIVSFLVFYYGKSLTKGLLEKFMTGKTGGEVEIGRLDYGLFPLRVQARSVKFVRKIGEMTVDLSAGSLNVKGEFKKLLKKEKPFFNAIEVQGSSFRVEIPKLGEKTDYEKNILALSIALSYVDRVSLKNFSLDYVYLANRIRLEKGSLELSATDKKGEFDFSLNSEKATVENASGQVIFEGSLESKGALSFVELLFLEGKFLFSGLNFSGKKFSLPELALEFKGDFLKGNIISLTSFKAEIPPLGDAAGSLKLDLENNYSFSVVPEIRLDDLSRMHELLKPFLSPYLSPQIKSLNLSGSAYLAGELENIKSPAESAVNFKGLVKMDLTKIQCETYTFSFENTLAAELKAEGSPPNFKYSGRLEVKDGKFSRNDLGIQNLSLDLPLSGTSSSLAIPRFRALLKDISLSSMGKTLHLDEVRCEGEAAYDIKNSLFQASRFELHISSLSPWQAEAQIDLRPQGKKYLQLKNSGIDLASLARYLSPFLPEKAPEWEPSGLLSLELEANSLPGTDGWAFSSRLDLSQGTFHNPPFTIAAEAVHPLMALKGEYNPSAQSLDFSLTFALSQGESLWNKYYLNWEKNPFEIKASGVFHLSSRQLEKFSSEVSLATLGSVKTEGTLGFEEPQAFDLELFTSPLSLKSLFALVSQDPTKEKPALDVDGEAEAKASFKKEGKKLSLAGEVQMRQGSIGNKDKGLFIEGMGARVPIFFESGQEESGQNPFLEKGYFSAGSLTTSLFSVAPFRLDFEVGRNVFRFESFSAEIFGGKEVLGKSVLYLDSEPFGFHGATSLSLSDVDISKFPLKSTQFSLSGTISANLDPIGLSPAEIRTQGQIEANMFDGKIKVQNFKVTRPFAKDRTISCDVVFEDLSLEKFTDSVPFGRVTGTLRGEIKDLAFSYGQPESFTMNVESVKKKGVPQKFSLGAVNDLSILSSGEGTAVPSKKGVTRFISEFGYEKIGIFCSLKNDVFILRGTIQEKGVEYLVKRSWLFGISVVNKKPRSRISFKDMVGRLKRIGRSKQSQ